MDAGEIYAQAEHDERHAKLKELERLRRDKRGLVEACEAVLIFHSGGEWDDAKQSRWARITGGREATTRVLCDTIRAALHLAGED